MTTEVILDDPSLAEYASTQAGLREVTALVRFFWTGRSVFELSRNGDQLITSLYARQNLDDARYLASVLGKVPVTQGDSATWRLCGPAGRQGVSGEIWDRPSLESRMSLLMSAARDAAVAEWAADYRSLLRELYDWADTCTTVSKGHRDQLFDHRDAKAVFAGGSNARSLLQNTLLGVFMFATHVSDPENARTVPAGAGAAKAMCESCLHPLLGPNDCTPERASRVRQLGDRARGVHASGFEECWHTKEAGRGAHRIYVDACNDSGEVRAAIGYIGLKLLSD